MTVSKDRKELYVALSPVEKQAVNAAFRAAQVELEYHDLLTAKDDRAENLIGALARYLVESRG